MSWDIVVFNSKQRITEIPSIDESQLEPTDFINVLENHFTNIERNENLRRVKGQGFSIEYLSDNRLFSNITLSLYGEKALLEIVILAKRHGWQIFDTGFEQMLDLDKSEINGYKDWNNFLQKALRDCQ